MYSDEKFEYFSYYLIFLKIIQEQSKASNYLCLQNNSTVNFLNTQV
jgi:hypothetical protein